MIVVEKKNEKNVQLITAYPVFFVSARKDYENDYQNYIKDYQLMRDGVSDMHCMSDLYLTEELRLEYQDEIIKRLCTV